MPVDRKKIVDINCLPQKSSQSPYKSLSVLVIVLDLGLEISLLVHKKSGIAK